MSFFFCFCFFFGGGSTNYHTLNARGSYEKQMRRYEVDEQTTEQIPSRHSVHRKCQGHFGRPLILSSSTSNISVALEGITGGNPREP